MDYLSISEVSKCWKISEQMVRRYCQANRIQNAVLKDGSWYIPKGAQKPQRAQIAKRDSDGHTLAKELQKYKECRNYESIYGYLLKNFTYSSCRMASNRLKLEQVDSLLFTQKISVGFEPVKLADCLAVYNHFKCIDYIIDHYNDPITKQDIQKIHELMSFDCLETGNNKSGSGSFRTSNIKEAGCKFPAASQINRLLSRLITEYEAYSDIGILDILNFHVEFERVHPFSDGNGRLGRLIMLKECLRNEISPFIIDDKSRGKYTEGIKKWDTQQRSLLDLVRKCQKRFESQYDYENKTQMIDVNRFST